MSYDPTLPTPRDRMRHRLGDIGEPPLRPDTEYDALLAEYDETTATVIMAESLAGEYAQNPSSVTVGGVSVSYSTLVQNWQTLAKSLRDGLSSIRKAGAFSSGIVDRGDMTTTDLSEYRRSLDDFPDGESAW